MRDLADALYVEPRIGCSSTLLDLVYGRPTLTPVFERLREQVNDLGVAVVILDNIGQTFGGNENNRHDVTLFINALAGLVTDRPFAPVVLGHPARSTGSEFAGSAAWENACRMRWYLGSTLPDEKRDADDVPPDDAVRFLCRRKANYAAKDWIRLRYQNGVLIPDATEGRRFDQTYRDQLVDEIVLEGHDKLVAMGLHPSDGKTSTDYLPRQLIDKGLHDAHSKKELTAAMHRLMAAGQLKREVVGRYSNRSPRYGLARP
jgi:RecA-family ATPase